jgi:hypothetical protein
MSTSKNDQVTAHNYCAHAIEDLRETTKMIGQMAPQSAMAINKIIELLQKSVKFVLPNCCNIIEPEDMRQAHLDQVRLPFPCVAFEAPWDTEEAGPAYVGDFKQSPATKRIALCWEPTPGLEILPGMNEQVLNRFPDGGVFTLPIYWGPEQNKWIAGMGGCFIPYGSQMTPISLENQLPATKIAHSAKMDSGQAKATGQEFRSEPFYVQKEFFDQTVRHYGSLDKAYAQIIVDVHDEQMILVQACSVINCENITTASIEPSASLNKKRHARGKQPFFTYKVLQINDGSRSASKGSGDGTHASPRMHLRRGHLRRYPDKTIWIRASMVNAEINNGFVVKDYSVSKFKAESKQSEGEKD